jgi:hypothetical protein
MSVKTEKGLLMAYSVLDELYYNGCVKQIRGRPAYDRGCVLSVDNPDTTYISLAVNMQDPKLLPFAFGQDPVVLIAKVTPGSAGSSSSCLYDLWAPDAGGGKAWKRLTQDVVLQYDEENVATNPNGMAQAGNLLFIVDYDSQKVYLMGANELNRISSGEHKLFYDPIDLTAAPNANPKGAGLTDNFRGQDIIAMKGPNGAIYVYALFINTNAGATSWGASTMVMMKLVVGADKQKLQYVTHTPGIGINAQEIIPVASDDTSLTFLIPCYGGPQNAGVTNGVESKIDKVVVHFGNPDSDPDTSNMTLETLITGDPVPDTNASDPTPPDPPDTYDIRSLAARLGGGWLYILCGTMNNDANKTQNWTIYKADLAKLLAITSSVTLSVATNPPPGGVKIMDDIDWGAGDPGYYWDICIEAGIDITGDRLWFLKGSDIMVTGAEEYKDDVKNFNPGYGIGELGGLNVNCAAFIAETLRQAALGLSLKRGLYGSMAPIVSAASQGQTIKY